jgi:putative membrane protein
VSDPRPDPLAPRPAPAGPRILTDTAEPPAPRIDFNWEQAVAPIAVPPPTSRRWSAVGLAATGVGVLLLGLSAIDVAGFVTDQFIRGSLLGWLTLGVAFAGYGLIGAAILRELRGLAGLGTVERGRAAVARGDFAESRTAILAWAARLPEAQAMLPALRRADDLPTLLALLEAGPLARLDRAAVAAGRAAALQSLAATAIVPSPALDGIFVAWRGVRLVREVAAIHGLRPGLVGTLKLLRRTLFEAGAVAAADVAINAAVTAVTTNPLVGSIVGDAATGAVAARRMLLLARATARACRIVTPR